MNGALCLLVAYSVDQTTLRFIFSSCFSVLGGLRRSSRQMFKWTVVSLIFAVKRLLQQGGQNTPCGRKMSTAPPDCKLPCSSRSEGRPSPQTVVRACSPLNVTNVRSAIVSRHPRHRFGLCAAKATTLSYSVLTAPSCHHHCRHRHTEALSLVVVGGKISRGWRQEKEIRATCARGRRTGLRGRGGRMTRRRSILSTTTAWVGRTKCVSHRCRDKIDAYSRVHTFSAAILETKSLFPV